MSNKKYRFKIEKVSNTVYFHLPNHMVQMAVSKGKNLFSEDDPVGISVYVGYDENYRINWKLRMSLVANKIEITLYDSKERKQVSVYIDEKEFIKGLIFQREIKLEEGDFQFWD